MTWLREVDDLECHSRCLQCSLGACLARLKASMRGDPWPYVYSELRRVFGSVKAYGAKAYDVMTMEVTSVATLENCTF